MAEQLGGFYVALLFLALLGVLIFVNVLLGMVLRWIGRRVASVCARANGLPRVPMRRVAMIFRLKRSKLACKLRLRCGTGSAFQGSAPLRSGSARVPIVRSGCADRKCFADCPRN